MKDDQEHIQKIGSGLLSYENKEGCLPNSDNWCDSIIESEENISGWDFMGGGKRDNTAGYAFNDNLSGISAEKLEPNTILIFETDVTWNFSGGSEDFPKIK